MNMLVLADRLSGTGCTLCGLPTLAPARDGRAIADAEDPEQCAGICFEEHTVHRGCALWAGDPYIRIMADPRELSKLTGMRKASLSGALSSTKAETCLRCGKPGASVPCAGACRMHLHLPCLPKSGCTILHAERQFRCTGCLYDSAVSNNSLPNTKRVKATRTAPAAPAEEPAARQPAARSGRSCRGAGDLKRRPLDTVPVNAAASRRPQRQAAKKAVCYKEPPLHDFGSEDEADAGAHDDASDASGLLEAEVLELEDEDDADNDDDELEQLKPSKAVRQPAPRAAKAKGRGRAAAAWGSDAEGDGNDGGGDSQADEDDCSPGSKKRANRRAPLPARKSQRKRVKTITFDEEVAIKAAQAAAIAAAAKQQAEKAERDMLWEDQACTRCGSKEDDADTPEGPMLLCDGCNKGTHLTCLKPPLEEVPEGSWHCADCASRILCEVCSAPAVKGAPGMGRLVTCGGGCGARCHSACLSEEGRQCLLCQRGFTSIKSILGCRDGRNSGSELEYYIRWTGRPFRDACWVGASAVRRMSKGMMYAFHNKHRGALRVEPEVQNSWSEVGRVIALRSGGEEVLVKWKGLDYGECTWEAADTVDAKHINEYHQRLDLRVSGQMRSTELPLPLELAAYVPPDLLLKDYQIEGVSWLLGKLQQRQNVILGDEMGLGKTIQAATLLAAAQREGLTTGPALIVAPLSTIGAWERELAKWAPELAVLPYIGGQDARDTLQRYEMAADPEEAAEAAAAGRQARRPALVPRFLILLTTFELASKDLNVLGKFDWTAQIIDEGHRLKSETSLVSKTLSSLSADWRCIMTGTPLQNELNELFCLLAFLEQVRAADIECLIEATPDPAALALGSTAATALTVAEDDGEAEERDEAAYARKLHAFLAPRMLRRLKHNVASLSKELPPKITRKVACRLSPLQRQLYVDILARNFAALNARAAGSSKNSLNNVLMNLRKACDHPFLFEGQEPPGLPDDEAARLLVACSGKMAMLAAMLPRLLAGGHRVLIFSQLKGVLTLLEDMLHDFPNRDALPGRFQRKKKAASEEGEEEDSGPVIPFFRLDGETKIQERQRQIDLFNDPGCEVSVFLMSTRAGGLGINLQSADTVILFDMDMNPFADLQAEGRAHRLGQQATVMVYQLFTAATVEERVLANAARKRKLEAVVCAHLGRGATDLSPAELRACLTHNAANLMVGADGDTGEAEVISDADLERLLDRSGLQPGDEAYCADELLGEVGEDKVKELADEAAAAIAGDAAVGSQQVAADGEAAARHAAEEARMLQLLAERAVMLEQAKLAAAGRGKRARRQVNYAAQSPSMLLSGATGSGAPDDSEVTPPSSPDSGHGRGVTATPTVRACPRHTNP